MNSVLKEIADALDGTEYPLDRIPGDVLRKAKENNIQVVFGNSDDLIEFDGEFFDELGAWISDDGGSRDYISSEGRRISAVWASPEASWTYRTDIRHETFRIVEDDTVYCIGIVFETIPGETWQEANQ